MNKSVIIKELKETAKMLVLAAIIMGVMLIFLQPAVVLGESMEPNYKHGDRFFIVRDWLIKQYKYGDVVCVDMGDEIYIKRIIGLPGDKIEIKDGYVYRNGTRIDESKYLSPDVQTLSYEENFEIENGYYFVLGDNRGNSSDSRTIGPVANLVGKSWFFYRKAWFS